MFDGSNAAKLDAVGQVGGGQESWQAVDRALRRLAKGRGEMDREEAVLLCRAERWQIWQRVGCASLIEYLEAVLGYGPRIARERLRVARELEHLPELADALASGALSYSAIRELTRVATRENEREWIAAVHGENLRQIEDRVSCRRKGDSPKPEPEPEPSLRLRTLSFKVRPATHALIRHATKLLADQVGRFVEDDEVIEALANAFLGGSEAEDHGRARHQVRVTLCPSCNAGTQEGGGRQAPLDAADIARVECDAQVIGDNMRAKQAIPPATRRFVFHRDGGTCVVPGCRAARHLDVHHINHRAHGGDHVPENLVLLCALHHRELHRGQLAITGRAPDILVTHVGRDNPVSLEVQIALVTLGYSKSEAKRMVGEAARASPPDVAIDVLLRAALQVKP